MLEVEQAISLLTDTVATQTGIIEVDLLDAYGHVTAGDIFSPIAVPGFAKSAMDGYALHSEDTAFAGRDTPVTLRVIGELCAGDTQQYTAAPGTAVRIMTGGAMPAGYDAVLRQEDSDYGEENVQVYKKLRPWDNYCPAAEDFTPGQLAIPQYTRLRSQHIGILASMGFAKVPVLRPFRVGVIATGNELALPGTPLGGAQLYNSSSYTIASLLKSAGVSLSFLKICPDDIGELKNLIKENLPFTDAIITTGGVSVGKKDILPATLESLGAAPIFRRVNMKPGTPVLASECDGKVILCLSGNPFAALVNFHLFFWPVLAKAMHNETFTYKRRRAVLCEGNMKPSGLRRFVRACKKEDGVHLYTQDHRSSVLSNLIGSNCIVDQPANLPLKEGDIVDILFWKN